MGDNCAGEFTETVENKEKKKKLCSKGITGAAVAAVLWLILCDLQKCRSCRTVWSPARGICRELREFGSENAYLLMSFRV